MIFEPVITIDIFVTAIEKMASTKNIPYIDAVLLWCQQNNIEIESAADWIKKSEVIKTKIQAEAEDLNIIKKVANLSSFMNG